MSIHPPSRNETASGILGAGQAAAVANLAANGEAYLATGTIPAFSSNASTIAPGTDLACYYPIPAATTVAATSAITISASPAPAVGNYHIACEALALTHAINVTNGGPAGGNLGSGFAASLSRGLVMHIWFDGTNYIFNGYDYVGAFTG